MAGRADLLIRVLVGVGLVAAVVLVLDLSVPRSTRNVRGVVVMFDTHATRGGVRTNVAVRLDDGVLALARNSLRVVTPVDSRVELAEWTGLVTGMRRYRLQRVLRPGTSEGDG